MLAVVAHVVSVEDDPFPGWVRLELNLADGQTAAVYEKQPVVGAEDLQVGATVQLACEVVGREDEEKVPVRFLHGIETTDGRSTVEVSRSQMLDLG
jgi:hypothetical protein